ncbi:TIM barrel protein [soil metagenome]
MRYNFDMNNAKPAAFLPGLVSITFRRLTPAEVIALASEAQLSGIEWGGDIHVPHGEIGTAREVARRTRDAGLAVAAYGSYYRVGAKAHDPFSQIVETAIALGTKIIRVWPGNVGSAEIEEAGRRAVIEDARRIADLAVAAGLTIACEWHGGTLTDTAASATSLFAAVDSPAFKTYWQPRTKMSSDVSLADIEAALPRLAGLHVFHWNEQTADRRPLAEGESVWRKYLDRAAAAPGGTAGQYALLEFIADDDPAQFLADAATLKKWLAV